MKIPLTFCLASILVFHSSAGAKAPDDWQPSAAVPEQQLAPNSTAVDNVNSSPQSSGISYPGTAMPLQASAREPETRYYSLGELIEQALKTNPRTHIAWHKVKSAQATLSIEESDAYPQVEVGGTMSASHRTSDAGRTIENSSLGPYAEVNYLLYDFGRRDARMKSSQHLVIAATLRHDAAVQEVILGVQNAYYQYLTLRYLAVAQEVVVKEAVANLDAAEDRRQNGVAALADVLQARTALARARLKQKNIQGDMMAIKGSVMTSVGLPLTARVDIIDIPIEALPIHSASGNISELLLKAVDSNPLLLAAKSDYHAANATIDAVKARGSPTIRARGRFDELYDSGKLNEELLGEIQLSFPLFTGYQYRYELQQAEAEARRSEADYKLLVEQRQKAIWSSFYDHQTAINTIAASDELYEFASQSHAIASGRYREGVGGILDLLAAQSALEEARFSRIQARMDWLLTLARLQYDLGILEKKPTHIGD